MLRLAILLVLTISLISGCSSDPIVQGRPIKTWKASSFDYAIVRKQDSDMISCLDHKFNEYVCMSEEDLQLLLETYDGCNCK